MHLFALFFLMALVHVPVIIIYKNYDYFSNEPTNTDFLSLSMGNMGFSESKCLIDTTDYEGIELECTTGTLASVSDFGVTTQFEDQ